MKKHISVLLALSMGCLVSCSDGDDVKSNSECGNLLPCADTIGQYCSDQGKCLPKKGIGESCQSAVECKSLSCNTGRCVATVCSSSDQCIDLTSKYCDTSLMICVDKKANGQSCDSGEQCLSGHCNATSNQCDSASGPECSETVNCQDEGKYCDANGSCQSKKADGVSCSQAVECLTGICNSQGKCGNESQSEPECSASKGCQDNSKYCEISTQTCQPKKSDAASCSNSFECISGSCTDDVCTEVSSETNCTSSGDCANTQFCNTDAGKCKDKFDDGTVCRGNEECKSDFCNAVHECQTLPSNSCSTNDDCNAPKEKCDTGTRACVRVNASDLEYQECDLGGDAFCSADGKLLECIVGYEDMMWMGDSCSGKLCVESGGSALCASRCNVENDKSTECDPNDEDGKTEIQLTCKMVNGELFAIRTGVKTCDGMMTCFSSYGDTACSF